MSDNTHFIIDRGRMDRFIFTEQEKIELVAQLKHLHNSLVFNAFFFLQGTFSSLA
jgi:hypothetical protein